MRRICEDVPTHVAEIVKEMEDKGSWPGVVDYLVEEAHLFNRQAE